MSFIFLPIFQFIIVKKNIWIIQRKYQKNVVHEEKKTYIFNGAFDCKVEKKIKTSDKYENK